MRYDRLHLIANYLVEERAARYLFTVKDNQPILLTDTSPKGSRRVSET